MAARMKSTPYSVSSSSMSLSNSCFTLRYPLAPASITYFTPRERLKRNEPSSLATSFWLEPSSPTMRMMALGTGSSSLSSTMPLIVTLISGSTKLKIWS